MPFTESSSPSDLCRVCGHFPCLCKEGEPKLSREQQLVQERESRPERLRKLQQLAEVLFTESPVLVEHLTQSFEVPQYGVYHREGMYMDTHLALMISVLERMTKDGIDPALPPELQSILSQTIGEGLSSQERDRRKKELQKYVLLHDISKKDCLTVRDSVSGDFEPTWEEWLAMLPEDLRREPDPVALDAFFQSKGWTSISYYQQNKRRFHGAEGAKVIREHGKETDLLAAAIEQHEVSFAFEHISAELFAETLGGYTEEEQNWIIVASYLDLLSALQEGGKVDAAPILNMLASRENLRLIHEAQQEVFACYADAFASGYFKRETVQAAVAKHLRARQPLSSVKDIQKEILEKLGVVQYDLDRASIVLQELEQSGVITKAQQERLLSLMRQGDGKTIGREFGRTLQAHMGKIKSLIV
jgi:hypothetical protein